MDPPGDWLEPPAVAPPPSIELSRSLSGLLDPVAPPPKIEPSGVVLAGVLALTDEALGKVGKHDRCQNRQQALNQSAGLTTEIAAQGLRHLILIGAEDVADDLLAVIGVDLVKIDSTVNQVAGMIAERSSQRPGTGGIFGVGLHAAEKRGDCLTCGLFGGGLINSQLRGELIHRNVGQDVL